MAIFKPKDGAGAEGLTLIGEEARFHGLIAAKGSLRVEGVVEGDITDAVAVEIGRKGRVKGNVAAQTVSVAGQVEGDIVCARSLEVLAGARLSGNIRSPSLRFEEGARFNGGCAMADGEGKKTP
ncbi:MAG: polymer-forming cytoskeletal protein [Elusimicrobia bacterium]|nr:polymer-forming cytoskeletal protein [Elusimicrobiota bacterium]MDE2236750.1 polymer-forming cytoskeletal protein [Elusimicrobiota bacterium]MDE2426109.1 polymer-forming cytoskeletal protein [Elusimicrobiota bacterium]